MRLIRLLSILYTVLFFHTFPMSATDPENIYYDKDGNAHRSVFYKAKYERYHTPTFRSLNYHTVMSDVFTTTEQFRMLNVSPYYIPEYVSKETRERVERINYMLKKDISECRSNMTPADSAFINQQRKLAANYCHLDWDGCIIIDISKREAKKQGIESGPYEKFEKWVKEMNADACPIPLKFVLAYYEIGFDDYVNEAIIKTRPRNN